MINIHKTPVKRRKILDHFAIVVCDGPEPRIVERWPQTDAECLYELPPALPYFVCDDFFLPPSLSNHNPAQTAVRRRWFGMGSRQNHEEITQQQNQQQRTFDKNTPKFYPFVLTGASGERIYGGSLLRLMSREKMQVPLAPLTPQDPSSHYYVEALCFLSRFPFFSLIHDMLYHIHELSSPYLPPELLNPNVASVTTKKKKTSASLAAEKAKYDAANEKAQIAANRGKSSNDIFLRVVLSNAPLGIAFSNIKTADGSNDLYVVESKGQTALAGVCVGDEIIELDNVAIEKGTTHEELRDQILLSRKTNSRFITMLVRVNAESEVNFRGLPGITSKAASPPSSSSSLLVAAAFEEDELKTATTSSPSVLPRVSCLSLERVVPHAMAELRLPPAGGTVEVPLGPGPRSVSYSRSATGTLPRVEDASFAFLWQHLSVETVVKLVECLVSEQRIVLVSEDVSLLAPIAEALLSFIFPFSWNHVYIPLLPTELLMYLEAPVPFFVGISASYLNLDVVANVLSDPSAGVTVLYIDSDSLTMQSEDQPSGLTSIENESENNEKEFLEFQKQRRTIPKMLREDLIKNITENVSCLKQMFSQNNKVPAYGIGASVASTTMEASLKKRKVKRVQQQKVRSMSKKASSLRRPSSSSSSFPLVPEVPEIHDESWFSAPFLTPSSSSSGSQPEKSNPSSTEQTEVRIAKLDLDSPRFHFIRLWAELLLPYADFLRPHIEASTPPPKTKEETAAAKQAKSDARDVHNFDNDGFLLLSPPHWRPFLEAFLGTNLFQAFNHQACENLRKNNRSSSSLRKAVPFFEKITQASTFEEMRMFVDESLCCFEDDADVVQRIAPPRSADRSRAINPTNATCFYSYTTFPSMVQSPSNLMASRMGGGGSSGSRSNTPTSSVSSSSMSSPAGRSRRPSKVMRRPSGREELLNAFESGEFRHRPSLSRTPSNSSLTSAGDKGGVDLNNAFNDNGGNESVVSSSEDINLMPPRLSRRASLSGVGFAQHHHSSKGVALEAEDAVAGGQGFRDPISNEPLRTHSLDRMDGLTTNEDGTDEDNTEQGVGSSAADWLSTNREKLKKLMAGSIQKWLDGDEVGKGLDADSDADSDIEGDEDKKEVKTWIPGLQTVNSFRFTSDTDDEQSANTPSSDKKSSNASPSKQSKRSVSTSSETSNRTSSTSSSTSFWSDMFKSDDDNDLLGRGSSFSQTSDSILASLQAQFGSPMKSPIKEHPSLSDVEFNSAGQPKDDAGNDADISGDNLAEEEGTSAERSSFFNNDLFSSPIKPTATANSDGLDGFWSTIEGIFNGNKEGGKEGEKKPN